MRAPSTATGFRRRLVLTLVALLFAMETVFQLDLDTLCIAAEVAAALLLLSLAWRPRSGPAESEPTASQQVDWAPLETTLEHALVATGRSLSLRESPLDSQRLRELQLRLPPSWRDRLTGLLNASAMDRLVTAWGNEQDPSAYASCYAMITLQGQDEWLEQHGAIALEMGIRRVGEHLAETLSDRAVVSRYQPSRFLIQRFASDLSECRHTTQSIIEQIVAPEFFTLHGESVPLPCAAQYWQCSRSVNPDELLQILEQSLDDGPSSLEAETDMHAESHPFETSTQRSDAESTAFAATPASGPSTTPTGNGTSPPIGVFATPWSTSEEDSPEDASPVPTPPVEMVSAEVFSAEAIAADPAPSSDAPAALAGYATADDIASLFSELQGSTINASSDALEGRPRTTAPDSDVALEASLTRPPVYTEGLEDSSLNDDLASLFATVRSSATGSFVHSTAIGSVEPNPE